jgi:RHS repeat-associated protein
MKKLLFLFSILLITRIPLSLGFSNPTGVSLEAIALPSLPGSIGGIQQTIGDLGSKGLFDFDIDIKSPKGVNNHTPSLRLSYSSGAGKNEFGLGWEIRIPSISRDTRKGVPSYSGEDQFWSSDGELVRIERSSSSAFYSPYINKDQNLYEFDEDDSSWVLHQGDGSKIYFGIEESSLISNGEKIFTWFADKMVDPFGNEIVYEYTKIDNYPYLHKVKYAFKNGNPHYTIQMFYEDRSDIIESYKSSFLVKKSKRCSRIKVLSDVDHVISSYDLLYNDASFLKEVRFHGENDADLIPPMPSMRFQYSVIDLEANHLSSKIHIEDSIYPPSLNKQRATIVDVNQDSFPDVIETSRDGAKVWLNDGVGGLKNHYILSEFIWLLGDGHTRLLDVDGDRVVDFVSTGLTPKFFRGGSNSSGAISGFSSTPTEILNIPRYSLGSPNVKTVDINGDGRLDIIARETESFRSYLSTSAGTWNRAQDFEINTGVFDLSGPYSFFSDMNGDGLTDMIFIRSDSVVYLPNTGTGIFGSPIILGFQDADPLILKLMKTGKYNFVSDISGDGLADLLSVTGTTIAVSLNVGDGTFAETKFIPNIHEDSYDLKGLNITTADFNGNGTIDILWTNDFGDWRYIDFSDGLLNLLTSVDNGHGLRTNVKYALASSFGSISESLSSNLPFPSMVVESIKQNLVGETNIVKEENYKYFGGYYSSEENEFRGFNYIEKIEFGDASIDSLKSVLVYEQGRIKSKDHLQMMLLRKADYEYNSESDTTGHVLQSEDNLLASLQIFSGLEEKKPTYPYVSQKILTEGDFEGNIRKHKVLTNFSLSSVGVIEKETTSLYTDLEQLLRTEEKVFAVSDIQDVHLTNKICEASNYNSEGVLQNKERFYFDQLTNLCSLNKGAITKKLAWNGSSFELKNSYTYFPNGSMQKYSDSFNHWSTLGYDEFDINLTSITNAAGHSRLAVYDSQNGLLLTLTDENHLTTSIYYDNYLRVTKLVGPADTFLLPSSEIEYAFGAYAGDMDSIFIKKREKSGLSGTLDTKEYFDGFGRSRFKITEGLPGKFVLEGSKYNKRGEKSLFYQKSFVGSFNAPETMNGVKYFETKYDSIKRPLLIFNPEHISSSPSYKEFYYLVGEKISYDEERKVSYEYIDALGRKTSFKDTFEKQVVYHYDSLDLIKKIIDPAGTETVFEYDSQKRRVCKLDSTVGLIKYSYNTENLVTQKDSYGYSNGQSSCNIPAGVNPRVAKYEYNDLINRITKIDFPAAANTEDILYFYDESLSAYPIGKLTSVSFGIGSKRFDYDIFGNKTKSTLQNGLAAYSTEKIFDSLGRIEKIIYPTIGTDSFAVDYEFDSGSNLISVRNSASGVAYVDDVLYSPLGQPGSIHFGNSTKTTFSYNDSDQSYRLVSILTEKMGTPNTTLQGVEFEYDKVGNVTQRNDLKNSFQEDYFYDDLHRLVSANLGGAVKNWTYDDIGSILNNNGVQYIYNPLRPQVISSVGGTSYSSDLFGNLTQDLARNFNYDWNNRLTSVTKSSLTTTYDYGEDGLRIRKNTPSLTTLYIDKYTELKGSDIIRHIFLGDRLIASRDEVNNLIYNHADHLRSSNLKTDSVGNIIKRIEYLPFGSKRMQSGTYDNIKIRFTSQYDDEESDLYYYQQRYYDPILSRFITADPLYLEEIDKRAVDTQELNLYAYVRNNPLKNSDPEGLTTYPTANPSATTDGFKMRTHPTTKEPDNHTGQDFSQKNTDRTVYATENGTITYIGVDKRGTNFINIQDTKGAIHGYFHTSTGLRVGTPVKEGVPIGMSDMSGRTNGVHLHYTYQASAKVGRTDPIIYLRANDAKTPIVPRNASGTGPAISNEPINPSDKGLQPDFWSSMSKLGE